MLKKSNHRRALSSLLAVVFMITIFTAPGISNVSAADISGTISESSTWSNGDIVSADLTIAGGMAEESPVVITVTGTVEVKAKITIASGYVKIAGGGTLIKTGSGTKEFLQMTGGCLTLENIILDGNNITGATKSLVDINAGTSATLIMNEGTVLRNNINTSASMTAGTVLLRGKTSEFIMNGGEIKDNTLGFGGAVHIHANTTNFTMNGGSISNNANTNADHKDNIAISSNVENPNINITPKATISISGGFDTAKVLQVKSIPLSVTPAEGFPVSSITINGEPQTPVDGVYPFNMRDVNTGLVVTMGDPGGDPDPDPGDPVYDGGSYAATGHAGYGGTISADAATGEFTVTATEGGYVIDEILIDGVPLAGVQGETGAGYIFPGATQGGYHSIVATFAYTVNFNSPANGTLSVSRGDTTLQSGDIVRGGEILTVTATPDNGYEIDTFIMVGLTRIDGTDTYTVTAQRGEPAPSITAAFAPSAQAKTRLAPPALSAAAAGITADSVTLAIPALSAQDPSAAAEYQISGDHGATYGAWQTSPAFTGLAAGTMYHFRARYAAGDTVNFTDSEAGSSVSFYTSAGGTQTTKLDPPVLSAVPAAVTANSVTLAAPAPSAQEPGATLLYRVSPDGTAYGSSQTGPSFSNLTADTAYYFQACYQSTGTGDFTHSDYGAAVQIRTAEDLRPDLPAPPADTDGYYLLSTADHLRWYRDEVNFGNYGASARLTADIDLSGTGNWTPIGKTYDTYTGSFDGNGKGISGLGITAADTSYIGLFGYVKGGEVKDLTVRGSIVCGGVVYIGGIAGAAGSGAKFTGCVSYVDITGEHNAGGIVCDATSGGAQIENCLNYGNISVAGTAGGITYRLSSSLGEHNSITGCGNYGDISGVNAAGIAGQFGGGEIRGCFNKGSVAASAVTVSPIRVAGIVMAVSSNDVTITDCYNTGAVSGHFGEGKQDAEPYVAGIFSGYRMGLHTGIVISNCYNTGVLSKTGAWPSKETRYGEITPAVILAGNNFSGWTPDPVPASTCKQVNCYTRAQITALTPEGAAAVLGAGYKADVNGVNGGSTPLLAWEGGTADTAAYGVSFSVTGAADYAVAVYTDSARTQTAEADAPGLYTLTSGTYYYAVSAPGCVTERGTVAVNRPDITVTVALRAAAAVTFRVTPADAALTVTGGAKTAAPDSAEGGVYAFSLYAGDSYVYSAYAPGHNGATLEFAAAEGGSIEVALTASGHPENGGGGDADSLIYGTGNPGKTSTVTEGGTYYVGKGATGTLTITAASEVILVGTGVGVSDKYENLYVNCTEPGTDLVLKDIYVSNTVGAANMIGFRGDGNVLRFSGTSVLDQNTGATGYAMIHVNTAASLAVGGVTAGDRLYFYKSEQGAGIGGNTGEYNGNITITGGNLFMKNSKQGALIGSGSTINSASTGSPGSITVSRGTLNLIAVSRSAAIGGSAGGSGAAGGTDVYIGPDANVNVNVDYSGAAIGGGGYAEGNDSNGGALHYTGGSIRTYLDVNAVEGDGVSLWGGITTPGVHGNAAITAAIVDGDGAPVYLLTFDTGILQAPAGAFTVKDGGTVIYSGDLHRYKFVNETLQKQQQISVIYTIGNWAPLDDPNLYLYLTAGNHALTVNGEAFTAAWDAETETFTVTAGADPGTGEPGEAGSGDLDGDGTVTVTDALLTAGAVLSIGNLTPAQILAADMDDDGHITMKDVILIARKAAGL
ncbi:MAG: dockerin type I repeat-containing protein [Clostridiales Family XIII bacterium]|jgi:hypothetical protein|nr:dockerin type I repeat-containing protein [Clostridiales Family XIII bacterium]